MADSCEQPVLESLTLDADHCVPCLLCDVHFRLEEERDMLLAHLDDSHKFIIENVDHILSLKKYILHWKQRFKEQPMSNICTEINFEEKQGYYLLSDKLAEDKNLRELLQKYKLDEVLQQQQKEREERDVAGHCLFCKEIFEGSRATLLNHMAVDHNFNPGHPDNLVYVDEFLQKLRNLLAKLQCLYCEKTFSDVTALKNHMRKKQHRKINPKAKKYDKYYVINYLELGKNWEILQSEGQDESVSTNNDDSDSESYAEMEEEGPHAVCLFCSFFSSDINILQSHMTENHGFNLRELREKLKLTFYRQIKLINFIRRQIHQGHCYGCNSDWNSKESVQEHMQFAGHCTELPPEKQWDQQWYYFPTYEDDHLLGLLEETDDDVDADVTVVCEDLPPVNMDSILANPSLREELLSS